MIQCMVTVFVSQLKVSKVNKFNMYVLQMFFSKIFYFISLFDFLAFTDVDADYLKLTSVRDEDI